MVSKLKIVRIANQPMYRRKYTGIFKEGKGRFWERKYSDSKNGRSIKKSFRKKWKSIKNEIFGNLIRKNSNYAE